MAKIKSRRLNKSNSASDTKEARLAAAQFFVKGDRVRHLRTGALGIFLGLHDGFALPETWVAFDSDTDSRIPVSCNPLLLELAQKDCSEHKVLRELGMLGDRELPSSNTWDNDLVESDEPATDETPALVDEAATVPEVAEELAGESTDHTLKAGCQTISQSACDMAGTGNEASAAAVEVVEELTPDEVAERHRLELKVERAFYEAGAALRELRDKKLYRSTHQTFEEYSQDRFGYNRSRSYQMIDAAMVVDNLKECPQIVDKLPKSESQCRPLTKLTKEQQRQAWTALLEETGGSIPTGREVKGIVERLKQKPLIKASDFCQVGDVFTLARLEGAERKYNGCWAITRSVNEFTLEVDVHDSVLQVKPDNLNSIDEPDVRRQLPMILERIKRLRECGLLDRCAYTLLESLGKQTYLTDLEEKLLSYLEKYYRVNSQEPL